MLTTALSASQLYLLNRIDRPFIWISLREPEGDGVEYDISLPKCATLILRFHDLVCEDWSANGISKIKKLYPEFVPFTFDMKKILDQFLEVNVCAEHCVVNCAAGVSRSAAIGAYVGHKTGEASWFDKYYKTAGKFPCFYVCAMLDLPIPDVHKIL